MLDKKRILFFTFLILISLSYVSALRISPAKIEINFKPGLEKEVQLRIDNSGDRELEVFLDKELAEYVTLDKDRLPPEGGIITVTLKLPEEFEFPGVKRVYVGARELLDKELASGIVVAVAILAPIYVDVPYPGRYLETSLVAHDANINEPITFDLNIQSKGKNQVSFKSNIEIYSELDELLDVLDFEDRTMNSGESLQLKKIWDSEGYSSGSYYALSKVDYGDRIAESRVNFRIGELIVEIINHTKKIVKGGIKPFLVEIESGWNDYIDGAYAEVSISNITQINIVEFKTSPTNLDPWERKQVKGYFDTSKLELGDYVAKITVNYYGKNVGKSVSKKVVIKIIDEEKFNYILIGGIITGGLIVLTIIFLIIKSFLFKHGKRK